MLGETVHAYILTPALAVAVPRLHSSAACRGDWGEAVEPTAIAVGCKDIAPHGACRAKTDRVFGECLKYDLTADTQRTKSRNLTDLYLSTFFRKRHTDSRSC